MKDEKYVPKKGDIFQSGVMAYGEKAWTKKRLSLFNGKKSSEERILRGIKSKRIELFGLSLERIEADYVLKSEADRLRGEVEKDIKQIRALIDENEQLLHKLNSKFKAELKVVVEADRKERDEKLFLRICDKIDVWLKLYDFETKEKAKHEVLKVFAEVDRVRDKP